MKKSSTSTREALSWWNTLTIPQKDNARRFCYPAQKSVYVSEHQICEMFDLRDRDITRQPAKVGRLPGYQGYHHAVNSLFKK